MYDKTEQIELIYLATFIMPILLVVLLVWFLLAYQRKKNQYEIEKKDALLREQSLIIDNQKAIENERNRIAAEMHDDLGSGLTVMKFLSEKIVKSTQDEKIKDDVNKIAKYSSSMVENMSEIIWAMNSRYDNIEGLIGYLRRFSTEFLEDRSIEHSFCYEGNGLQMPISGEKRRNIFLVVKEILNNTVKYSNAQKICIQIKINNNLEILISEVGGKGFELEHKLQEGNGLFNIQKRISTIGANITYNNTPEGMKTKILMPMNIKNQEVHLKI
ncbi:MAG: hypothetical protein IPK35_14235 [Saprospiraceae bacterium]|jgi:signal transduction histidine kinase|nr:hypothetical protein [Saprospiraceae bacterium]